MKLTKYGHSCILLDDGTTKILFDPGSWSQLPDLAVDAIIITHTHQDHYDVEKINKLLAANMQTRIITNLSVAEELKKHNLQAEVVEQGQSATVGQFKIEGMGNDHAMIHPSWPTVQNTSYMINGKILHPGDALYVPTQPVEVLLLPVVAPWSKISETLDYISAVKPKTIIPIHDAFLNTTELFHRIAGQWAENIGAKFILVEPGKTYET